MPTETEVQIVQKAIRSAHHYNKRRGSALADLPGISLGLYGVIHQDGTPWWDRPEERPNVVPAGEEGEIVAIYPSGEEVEIQLSEVPTWEALAARLVPSQAAVDAAAAELERLAGREAELVAELDAVRAERDRAMIAAEDLGISRYRIAKLTGKTDTGVKKILAAAKRDTPEDP